MKNNKNRKKKMLYKETQKGKALETFGSLEKDGAPINATTKAFRTVAKKEIKSKKKPEFSAKRVAAGVGLGSVPLGIAAVNS